MIRFLDLDTKKTFNGSQPYVFDIGESTSTGMWVSKALIVVSDQPTLDVSFGKDSLFHLADLSNAGNIEINGKMYTDIDTIKTQSMSMNGENAGGDKYLYKLNILFMTDTEGEFHDFLNISGEDFEFAVDAYSEDERLPIDMANLGFEMPKQFQRAIYDSNVREESDDYILLNRKWKELLIEYWNVIANKGSYDSLINSLKFFEYGDLVKISEYWKYVDSFDNELLIGRDIEQILSSEIRDRLDVLTKTTYIGLNMLVNGFSDGDYVKYPEGTLDLDPNKFIPEPVPQLEYLSLKWSIDDLAMKMTLLANYFSTYFMPIHLDLIHASVDRLIFTNCIKILHSVRKRREDWWDDQYPIECNLAQENTYWIGNEHAYNHPDTALRNYDKPTYWGDLTRIGMDPTVEQELTDTSLEEMKKYLNQYFGGVGVVVPVNCSFRNDTFIKSIHISVYRQINDSNYSLVASYKSFKALEDNELDFNLLFVKSGLYLIQLQLTGANGFTCTGSWYITVVGSIGNLITVKKLRKIDYPFVESSKEFDDWFYDNLDFNSFMFTEPFAEQIKYKQWIVPTDGYEIDGIGLNQLLVIDCGTFGTERPVRLKMGDNEYTEFYFDLDIASRLSEAYPHYWWKLLSREVARKKKGKLERTEESRYYVVGIRKYFDTDGGSPRELFSDYVTVYKDGELDDLQNVIVKAEFTPSRTMNHRGFLIVTAPVGTVVTIDGRSPFECVSDTTTIPLQKEKTRISIDYKAFGHLFHKDLEVSDMKNYLGSPEYIVHTDKVKGFTTIETSRFFPIFHKLEDISDDTVKLNKDTVVCMPDFRWVDKQVDNTYWEFVNATTGEITYSKSFKEHDDPGDPLYIQEPFISKYDFKNSLSKGYYDIVLHFTMGGTEQTETVLSAFRIE